MNGSRRHRGTRFSWVVIAALALSLASLTAIGVAKDRNDDGLPDRWERRHHLSLQVDQARRDQDGDALRNRGEYHAGMDPRDDDSDDDGVEDGDEGAGTISAWDPDTGELTVALFGGGEVTGTVTDETEIECANDDAQEPDPAPVDEVQRPAPPESAPAEGAPADETETPAGAPGPGGGPDHAGEHDCDGSRCSVDDLAVDGVVDEASLRLTSDGLVFEEIELG